MSKKFKFLGLVLIALLLVVGVGASSASADLTVAALTITSSGALTLEGAAASAITVGALNTGGISIGGGNTAKTINLGTGTAIDTINIGTGATGVDVIRIGQAAADLALTDANWSITTAGLITTADDLAVNGDDVTADGDLTVTGATGANVVATTGTLDLTSSASAVTITATGATAGDVTVTVGDDFTVNGVATSVYGIGTGNVAQTLNLGTGTDIDTINIGTGATGVDVITVGSATATLVLRAGSATENEVGITATDNGTGSFQGIWAEVTLPAAAMTSSYHGGIMGNVFGTDLADTDSAMFGVLGKYTIDGTNASTEPSGGVIGEISGDPITTTADGAVIAVLGGDAGIATATDAFKVMGQNSTAGSGFTYGLDLFNANTGAYLDNDQIITTDIRLQNGETISNGTDGMVATSSQLRPGVGTDPGTCDADHDGALFFDTNAGTGTLVICDGGNGDFETVHAVSD